MTPILLVDDTPKNLSNVLSRYDDDVPKIVDIDRRKPYNKNMNITSLAALAMLGGMGGGKPWDMPAYNPVNFNLRRDNDRDALESANRKIALAQEENRQKKLARAVNKQ